MKNIEKLQKVIELHGIPGFDWVNKKWDVGW